MHRRVFNPLPVLQLKRHFQIRSKLLVYLAKKVIHISRPTPIGNQAVNPAPLCLCLGALLIVHHVIWQFITNHFSAAKHQQPCKPQSGIPLFTVLAKRANTLHKLRHRQVRPYMTRLDRSKAVAVGCYRVHIQIREIKTFEDAFITRILHPLGQHAAYSLIASFIITFIATQIRAAHGVATHMHRPDLARSARDFNSQDRFAVYASWLNLLLGEKIDAHLLAIVQVVPQGFAHFFRVSQA